jgi:Contractile injection system tube protein/LysM domain
VVTKLLIAPLKPSKRTPFTVPFNPNSYSIAKTVVWSQDTRTPDDHSQGNRALDAPTLRFGGGGSRNLTLHLFFDVTEDEDPRADVRTQTDQLVQLTRIEPGRNQPPVCKLSWGHDSSDFPFDGVVTSLTQTFVLFRSSGEPVRANVDVVFTEHIDAEMNKRVTDPDFTTYVVKRGDTLSAIASALYRDPTLWRVIATANGIDDPLHLRIGARLAIPALALPR